ncbi:S-layer homology domain-containing protein [Paenibacillus sp. F6_3S_P_1C]|uniref:S-layer homology domain-containing protein n=1 Tax=Paenibacillus vandeheii TaxID=3035917 RepID=A0ABT8J9J5_9BACL|nr:S-layer homology domain-containing protein [Paenibacillus vandeheii]MDN4601627.1 S-layer homology domain-containing protein [Paenibacillus vandeheii]
MMNRKVLEVKKTIAMLLVCLLVFGGVPGFQTLGMDRAYAASGVWTDVGGAGFTAGQVENISLVFDREGTPYTVFRDLGNNNKATVMKFNLGQWEPVGAFGFTPGEAWTSSLAFDAQNVPYVAYQDMDNSNKATVMKFNGSQWEVVGSAGFTPGTAVDVSLAFNPSNVPYISYRDGSRGNKMTVMRLSGNQWEVVGGAGFSAGAAYSSSLKFNPAGMPYVAYQDAANSNKATVMKLNGSQWQVVERAGFTTGQASDPSLAFGPDGSPYLAFQDGSTSYKATVMKFNGSQWEVVGNAGFSSGSVYNLSLAFDPQGVPYTSFRNSVNFSMEPQGVMMKLDGNQWTIVGGKPFSAGQINESSLAFGPNGMPYVAYVDGNQENKMTVMTLSTEHSVTYNANGATTGNVPVDNQKYETDATVTVLDNTGELEKEDYQFTGWNTAANGSGISYSAEDTFIMIDSDVTLYAQWQPLYVNISFESNGGTEIENQKVNYNSLAVNPEAPEKAGYTFSGWYRDSQLLQVFDFNTNLTENITLYAKWKSSTATLSSLTVSSGQLTPDFSAEELDYLVDIESDVTSVSFSLSKGNEGQGVIVTGTTGETMTDGIYTYTVTDLVYGSNPVIIDVQAEDGSSNSYTLNFNRIDITNAKLSAMNLTNVTLSPVFNSEVELYEATVSNSVSTTEISVEPDQTGVTVRINGVSDNSTVVPLVSGVNTITIEVTALDGVSKKTYTLNIKRNSDNSGGSGGNGNSGGGSGSSGGSSSGGSNTSTPGTNPVVTPPTTGAQVLVNGKAENAGSLTTSEVNGQKVVTLSVDARLIAQKLQTEGNNAIVTIPVTGSSPGDRIVGELTGQTVKLMADKQAVLVLQTDIASYTLPAQQVNIEQLAQQLGVNSDNSLENIKLRIEISQPSEVAIQTAQSAAEQNGYALLGSPVDFKVTAAFDNKSVSVDKFNSYVSRTIALPGNVDPNQITTGVVIDEDGTVRHIPTKITQVNGIYHAQINSLTNSVYAVIWHPHTFTDVARHWAEIDVNDMGSRMVVQGITDTTFEPNRGVTRAEFAAILVRGLGLKPLEQVNSFKDVYGNEWYTDAVNTASSYGLIDGYEDGTFRPQTQITRQEAMVLIKRATKLTGMDTTVPAGDVKEWSDYADAEQVASWAEEAVSTSIYTGLVSGRGKDTIVPKQSITRAETAVIIRRLLQHSGLI